MFRTALLIAFVVATTPSVAQEAWMAEIQNQGWTRVPSNRVTDWMLLIKDADTPAGESNKRIEVRFEWESAQDTMLSASALYEVDCLEWRMRALTYDVFTERNLQGVPDNTATTSNWVHVAPNTVYAAIPERACGR
jgi:hypothetical protein